jgi:hypothetical protein
VPLIAFLYFKTCSSFVYRIPSPIPEPTQSISRSLLSSYFLLLQSINSLILLEIFWVSLLLFLIL